jgi:cell division protein FtsB
MNDLDMADAQAEIDRLSEKIERLKAEVERLKLELAKGCARCARTVGLPAQD